MKIGSDHAFAAYIEHKIIVDRYSPGCCSGRGAEYPFAKDMRQYSDSYIDKQVFYKLGNRHLWEKWKKRPKKTEDKRQRVVHPKLPSIEIRPEHITQREEYGHWEMDLVVSGQNGRSVLLTLTERLSRQGDHRQAAGQASGDHTQGHRPNGA